MRPVIIFYMLLFATTIKSQDQNVTVTQPVNSSDIQNNDTFSQDGKMIDFSTTTTQDFITIGKINVTRNPRKPVQSKTCKVGNSTFIYDNEFAFAWDGCWLVLCIYDRKRTVKPGVHLVPCEEAYRHFADLDDPDNLDMVESDCEKCTGKPQQDPMITKKWYQWILPIPG